MRSWLRGLLSPQSGLLGQLVRFGMVGGLVTLFYLTTTTLLYKLAGLPFQVALAIGFVASLLLHFTLQRLFVWMHADGFALPFRHQVGRYVTMAGFLLMRFVIFHADNEAPAPGRYAEIERS